MYVIKDSQRYKHRVSKHRVSPETIDIIRDNAKKVVELEFELIASATSKIEFLFSSANIFYIQERIGTIQALKHAAKKGTVNIRILTPKDEYIEQRLQKLKKKDCFDAQYFTSNSDIRTKTLIIDRRESLVMEIKDEEEELEKRHDKISKEQDKEEEIISLNKIIGLSTYSNSKSTVLSYVAMFDTLWNETELHEQLRESNNRLEIANEQLRDQDKMQKEFINMAAHELRTPITPILGGIDLLKERFDRIKDEAKHELDMISRNASRLQKLAEDMLEIGRIEDGSFILNMEEVNINSLISCAIDDVQLKYAATPRNNVPILFESNSCSNIAVLCDQNKISQVLFNLLDNAMKFTTKGRVTVSAQVSSLSSISSCSSSSSFSSVMPERRNNDNHPSNIVVTVSDTGRGIDPSISNTLFEKFVRRSENGAGVGLYLSRKIIEAHGGRIWAENNTNNGHLGEGATFTFGLPLHNAISNTAGS